jgi:hypothetical protein
VLGFLARDLQSEILQHPPIDPIGGPVDLSAHHSLAVGSWAASSGLDVAHVSSGSVQLASEGFTTGHYPFSTMVRPDAPDEGYQVSS